MFSIALTLIVPLLAVCASNVVPPVTAVVAGERVYWQGYSPADRVFRLHSTSPMSPMVVESHNFSLLWSSDQPIAWHIRDKEVWAVTCRLEQPTFESYYLSKMPLASSQTSGVLPAQEVLARCGPLEALRNSLHSQNLPPVYFDFVSVVKDRGRLFALASNRVLSEWDYSFVVKNPNAVPPDRKIEGKWTKVAEYPAEFFEPFTIFMQPNGPAAVTESGRLYTLRGKREWARLRKFPPHGQGGIVAVIEDLRTGKTHAFTKTTCFTLSNPDVARPFKFPDRDDHPDSIAKALVQAVEFLDQK